MTNEELKNMLFIIDTLLDDAITDSTRQKVKDNLTEVCQLAIKALKLQPSEDCISRQAVDDAIYDYSRSCDVNYEQIMEFIDKLPSVIPKYTDEEIDKAQAVEQAYVDKMVELAVEESRKKWLNSFDTSSATKCFEAVNLLKQRLEGEE